MCGIVGMIDRGRDGAGLRSLIRAMSDAVAHRGPDGAGLLIDADVGLALGHRRLVVIDPSPAGDQPMESVSGRYAIVANGEIYNFRRLRNELEIEGYPFFGRSDTEVLLAAIDFWGIATALQRVDGMFAFAIWDSVDRVLTLARDRVGEKPLYFGWFGDVLLFGSELRALRVHPAFEAEIDPLALAQYLRDGWYSGERTVYRKVHRLRPGHVIAFSPHEQHRSVQMPYWSPKQVAAMAADRPFSGSYADAVAELDSLLRDAVRDRLVSDVPLGALLSGGVDSSTVVAMMAAASSQPVRTFTIGFPGTDFDEAPHAREVARHLGCAHTNLQVDHDRALAAIPPRPSMTSPWATTRNSRPASWPNWHDRRSPSACPVTGVTSCFWATTTIADTRRSGMRCNDCRTAPGRCSAPWVPPPAGSPGTCRTTIKIDQLLAGAAGPESSSGEPATCPRDQPRSCW
jgi:asparagine synthase (glutamine-hydrolysing)